MNLPKRKRQTFVEGLISFEVQDQCWVK